MEEDHLMNTHLHITSWVLAIVLLLVVIMLHKQGKGKGAKITQMILRLDYLLILYSGGSLLGMFFSGPNVTLAIIKALAGLWTIAAIVMLAIIAFTKLLASSSSFYLFSAIRLAVVLGFFGLSSAIDSNNVCLSSYNNFSHLVFIVIYFYSKAIPTFFEYLLGVYCEFF